MYINPEKLCQFFALELEVNPRMEHCSSTVPFVLHVLDLLRITILFSLLTDSILRTRDMKFIVYVLYSLSVIF